MIHDKVVQTPRAYKHTRDYLLLPSQPHFQKRQLSLFELVYELIFRLSRPSVHLLICQRGIPTIGKHDVELGLSGKQVSLLRRTVDHVMLRIRSWESSRQRCRQVWSLRLEIMLWSVPVSDGRVNGVLAEVWDALGWQHWMFERSKKESELSQNVHENV